MNPVRLQMLGAAPATFVGARSAGYDVVARSLIANLPLWNETMKLAFLLSIFLFSSLVPSPASLPSTPQLAINPTSGPKGTPISIDIVCGKPATVYKLTVRKNGKVKKKLFGTLDSQGEVTLPFIAKGKTGDKYELRAVVVHPTTCKKEKTSAVCFDVT